VLEQIRLRCQSGRTIADEGPGLDGADKTAAFERFWRADTSGPGTGLGMAIAHNIITASGGTMALSDNTPTGLVVIVTLPTATVASEGRPRRSRSGVPTETV
jgi:signal transduction histidine kinase